MKFSSLWRKHAVIVLLLAVIGLVTCFYQTQKMGFHEDEVYSIASAVNPGNGLMTAYGDNLMPEHGTPVWKTAQEVRDFVTLTPDNYFNFHAIYRNQALDDHPPFFLPAGALLCPAVGGQVFQAHRVSRQPSRSAGQLFSAGGAAAPPGAE